MTDNLTFEVSGGRGIFVQSAELDRAQEKLDELMEEAETREFETADRDIAALKRLVAKYPDFIDGYAQLGMSLFEQDKPKLALKAYQSAFECGKRAIPAGFVGTIDWGHLENRPFLDAAQGTMVCYLRLDQRRNALGVMEQVLAWNPDDQQGIRYIIGTEYLRAGMRQKAEACFAAEADEYPPYQYEYALFHLLAKNYVAAATCLRRGFVANGYIAEMLTGNIAPVPMAIWHGSSFAAPDLAADYIVGAAPLWFDTVGAVEFLRWVHMHPKVLVERAAVLECQEALLWERDGDRRMALGDRLDALEQGIDDTLSEQIIKTRIDEDGKPIWPWLYEDPLMDM
jgi:tetratricopeptide (TPR) repeat protein